MNRRSVYFTGPETVAVERSSVPDPGSDEVLVRASHSAVSTGTELLVYRDQLPADVPTDETIDALDGTFSYPLQYGYASVGVVAEAGNDVDEAWVGRRVFAFHPHESHYLKRPDELVPTTLPPLKAALLANVESAVNFVMDGRPRIGERCVVYGQGPVGLLTTRLLAAFPLDRLVTVDCYEERRTRSLAMGADAALAPDDDVAAAVGGDGADLTFELSGNPAALDDAYAVTGYAGEIVVGSWYGTRDVTLDLGGAYHRSHIRTRSSQVSRVDPDHAGRWDTDRRLAFAQNLLAGLLADVAVDDLVTHQFPVERAPDVYRLLSERKGETVQVLFTYE